METSPPALPGRGRLVLGIDDAAENLLFLKSCLSGAGYNFLAAPSGAEALGLLVRVTPRFILLDIEMPGLDGFETCRAIRERRELAAVPVIFLSARKSVDDVKAGIAAGGNDFITKPFDRKKLLDRLVFWTTNRIPMRAPSAV